MQFRRGQDLEQMPEQLGGLAYNKNYVARSRMEEVLQQDEEEQTARKMAPPAQARLAGVDQAPLRKRSW